MREGNSPVTGVPRDPGHRALVGLLEVVLVALLGSLSVQILFHLLEIGNQDILADTKLLVGFMMLEASVTLLLILLFLFLHGESRGTMGFVFEGGGREIRVGLAVVPILFASTFAMNLVFQVLFPDHVTTVNPLLSLIQERRDLALFLVSSVYVGGIKEEIQRAFVLDRFERYLGEGLVRLLFPGRSVGKRGDSLGLAVGLILWSLFFAFGHSVQGIDNAVGAGVLGLLFGLLYIWRRKLLAPVTAHALFDIGTLLAYWNLYGGSRGGG